MRNDDSRARAPKELVKTPFVSRDEVGAKPLSAPPDLVDLVALPEATDAVGAVPFSDGPSAATVLPFSAAADVVGAFALSDPDPAVHETPRSAADEPDTREACPIAQAQRDRRRATWLFLLTLCTTAFSGLLLSRSYADLNAAKGLMGFDFQSALPIWYQRPSILREAASFPLALLGILGCHEFGHYLQAKRHDVDVSPPFFLPSVPPLGTLGAVIRMNVGEGTTSTALMRVAAWGPIGGMIPAVAVLVLGISWSELRPLPFDTDTLLYLRGGVLMQSLERLLLGPLPPGFDVFLHPVAFAGWAGCFVTALNMLPIGQLDGGHVIYALSPRHSERVAKTAFWALIVGGVFYTGWWIFALLLRFVVGVVHPPMTTDGGARGKVRGLGFVAIVLFLLTFHPTPISHSGVMDLWESVQNALPYAPLWFRG